MEFEETMQRKVKRRHVVDNVHGIIRLTNLEHAIASGFLFNRLHYVYQLSTAFLTWPTARTQRYEHSLGTMHLAGKMFYNALANAGIYDEQSIVEDFAEIYRKATIKLIKDKSYPTELFEQEYVNKALEFLNICREKNPIQPELLPYTFLIPMGVPHGSELMCLCVAQGVRLAGMLHDVGHPPLSHISESILSEIYDVIDKGKYQQNHEAKDLHKAIDKIRKGSKDPKIALHEAIGIRLAAMAMHQALLRVKPKSSNNTKQEDYETGFLVASIFIAQAILTDCGAFQFIHPLVSGTIDADRLDYVQRDAMACDLGADSGHYGRLVESIRLWKRPHESATGANDSDVQSLEDIDQDVLDNVEQLAKDFIFVFPSKTTPTADELLRDRFFEYKTVVNHHHVVKSDQLIRAVLLMLARRYFSDEAQNIQKTKNTRDNKETLSVASDSSLRYILPDNVSGLWKPIIIWDKDPSNAELAFGQWTDSWLLTMLKNEYIRLSVDIERSAEDNTLFAQLSELFFSKKSYESVVKRGGDCRVFRKALASKLNKYAKDEHKLVSDVIAAAKTGSHNNHSTDVSESEPNAETSSSTFLGNAHAQLLEDIFSYSSKGKLNELTWFIKDRYDLLCALASEKDGRSLPITYEGFMYRSVLKCLSAEGSGSLDIDKEDVIVIENKIKIGIDTDSQETGIESPKNAYFYNENQSIVTLNQVSSIRNILDVDKHGMPTFFAYVCIRKDPTLADRAHSSQFFDALADCVAELVYDAVRNGNSVVKS